MSKRIYNFSAGPATLPLEVLETAKEAIINYDNTGIGVMELSHRSAPFESIIKTAESNFRELLDIDDSYAVLFVTGGATQQFSMIPMNLLNSNTTGNYIITDSWSEAALKEAQKFGEVHVAANSKDRNFAYIPQNINLSASPAYLHFTSNNTIAGTQFKSEPTVPTEIPLICDASSDLLHKKIDVKKYALIYAGAQKNLGPAGVTVVIIRKDLLTRTKPGLPILLDYNTHAKAESLYNTPPTFPIYIVGEVLKWIKKQGGLNKIQQANNEKAQLLYSAIDTSNNYYQGICDKDSRSVMNVTFKLQNKDLEPTFLKEATAAGLSELKGHRSVGGFRASIYNAFPKEGVERLVEFIKDFAKRN